MTNSSTRIPNNLPIQLTSFVGREAQIKEVENLIHAHREKRLITIATTGGAGKTRLSLEVAARELECFEDGVWFVELAALTPQQPIEPSLATVLDIHETAEQTLLESLTTFLHDKHALIILDNCEHVMFQCAQLAKALLAECRHLQILTTSREALGLPCEIVWSLPPLAMPSLADLQAADDKVAFLLNYEAVQLFVERARAVQSAFVVTEQNAPAVLELCQKVDGLPLAIELAAARVKMLTVEQIVIRLKDAFKLLIKGNPDQLPRQQTLRALIDWSYHLLTRHETLLFQRLAIFAGGWSLEAAEIVCRGGGLSQDEIGELLEQLVNKSLVVKTETSQHETYYRLLETIRQYASEALQASNYYETTARNHGEYFLQFAETAEPKLRSFEQKLWLHRLELNHDNLRTALHWFLERPNASTPEIERGTRLAGALWWFWWRHGHLVEGRKWLEAALSKTWVGSVWLPKPVLAKCTHGLAGLAYHMSDYETARRMWEDSLKLKRELGDAQGISYTLNNLGEMAQRQGDYRLSIALHEESLAIKRHTTGDRWGAAYSLNEMGTIVQRQGDYARAKTMLEEALALFEETGHRHGVARSYHNLGKVELCLGNAHKAVTLHERSQIEFEELGERSGIADALDSLGLLALFDHNAAHAEDLLRKALTIFQEVGDRWGVSYALNDLGLTALFQSDYGRAEDYFRQSLALKQKLNDKESIAWTLEGLAVLAILTNDRARAGYLWGGAERLRTKLGTPTPPANRRFYDELLVNIPDACTDFIFVQSRQNSERAGLEQVLQFAMATAKFANV
jgi:predicted ATPase